MCHYWGIRDREAIATARANWSSRCPLFGVAILNADDPLVAAMAECMQAHVVTFGVGEAAQVQPPT